MVIIPYLTLRAATDLHNTLGAEMFFKAEYCHVRCNAHIQYGTRLITSTIANLLSTYMLLNNTMKLQVIRIGGKTESLHGFLQAFCDATKAFSADKHPTFHLFLKMVHLRCFT
uniref:Uncharacterized protein n=1 Tax=Oryza glumipatula TaxID=40148 RepID=A0A0E0BR92_9ORYZ